ncbi:autophagy-related protein 13-domain-containing protein [Mycena floridula]|nr:autophagy-related protein 13-domain-containing protein [Mycena floridula]
MSQQHQKSDQIAFHFYTKLFYVVQEARGDESAARTDKWFNLETPDSDVLPKEIRERYKSISVWCHDASASTSSAPPPPLEIQVVLQVPELNNKDVLVHLGDTNGTASSSRTPLIPTPRWILLETYTLEFASPIIHDIPLSTIYKHGIPLFRSLYSLLRVLPAWRMRRRGRTGSNPASRGAGPIAGKGRNGIGDIVVRVREDEYGASFCFLFFVFCFY